MNYRKKIIYLFGCICQIKSIKILIKNTNNYHEF
jgi:hypothetical protein